MRVTVVQMQSRTDKEANLATAQALCEEAIAADSPDMLVLPEVFAFQGGSVEDRRAAAEPIPEGRVCGMLRDLAVSHGVFVHGGSFLERDEDTGAMFNTTVAWDRRGGMLARYRKIHRFDMIAPDGAKYRESELVSAGSEVVTYDAGDIRVGCAICYDLRFGELFRKLAEEKVSLIALPSAFTYPTGYAHWRLLLRARAVDAQCHIAAAAQCGQFPTPSGERRNWGHAMIVGAWGEVLAEMQEEPGFASATLDIARESDVRRRMPVASHRVLKG